MAEEDSGQEKELKYDVPSWLENLLDLAHETGNSMFETELTRKDSQLFHESDNREKEFKALLRQLFFWYKPKFEYSENRDLSEDLREKLDNAQDVWRLDFDESRHLFREIRDLMEDLGHTRFEGNVHSETGF
ncbi:MAG: hypothetical protein ABEK04_03620 [Candidatus Nanohalobium sp.]